MKKSKAKFFEEEDHSKFFNDVAFVIEATENEQYFLWGAYYSHPGLHGVKVNKWEEITLGHGLTIGELDNRPICVHIRYAKLNDKKVMFYCGMSQLVDYALIDKWLDKHSKHIKTKDGRWAHCDAINFGHCLNEVQDRV